MSKTCNSCGTDNKMALMPVAAHERDMQRADRREKRLVAVIILLILLLVGSNIGWLIYQSQFETVTTTTEEHYDVDQDADSGGDNNAIINGGEMNGEANDKVYEENNN